MHYLKNTGFFFSLSWEGDVNYVSKAFETIICLYEICLANVPNVSFKMKNKCPKDHLSDEMGE